LRHTFAVLSVSSPAKAGDPARRGGYGERLTSLEYWIPRFRGE
jgi:hypothetical protein